jgi:hypothetical protein
MHFIAPFETHMFPSVPLVPNADGRVLATVHRQCEIGHDRLAVLHGPRSSHTSLSRRAAGSCGNCRLLQITTYSMEYIPICTRSITGGSGGGVWGVADPSAWLVVHEYLTIATCSQTAFLALSFSRWLRQD